MGFDYDGDAVKWRKHGGGEDRRRSSGRRDAPNGGGRGGCIYEGTSVGDDNDVFGEKLREESVVVIQVENQFHRLGDMGYLDQLEVYQIDSVRNNDIGIS